MTLHERAPRGRRRFSPCILATIGILVAGCGSSGSTAFPTGDPDGSAVAPPSLAASSASVGSAPPASTAPTEQGSKADIPPGRETSEGGGGPVQYTFREEWRRALAAAQRWRSGAYLISAAGDQVNDEGVPSHWSLDFIDRVDADAVLIVEIDPWGTITRSREVTGDGVGSFVDSHTNRIPYDVLDSDTAVQRAKAALASRYDLGRTRDPRIGLHFSALDSRGPYWSYTLFDASTADYISAQIDARSGEVVPAG